LEGKHSVDFFSDKAVKYLQSYDHQKPFFLMVTYNGPYMNPPTNLGAAKNRHYADNVDWAGAYYRQQKAKGTSHQAAVRALAFKWIRILYRCWQARMPYDELVYLQALRRRGSPLLDHIGAATEGT